MKLIVKTLTAVLLTALLWHCASTSSTNNVVNIDRPLSPWAFRSVLDQQPRMLTLALHDDVWAAYNTQTCALYKVWKGNVNLDGAVYTTVHGPQPSTLGDTWFENKYATPWVFQQNGTPVNATLQYKGHHFEKGQVVLSYQATLASGATLTINERPEFIKTETVALVFN